MKNKTKLMLKECFLWFRVTVNPKYWLSNYSINKELDSLIREKISNLESPTDIGSHTCHFNDLVVWIRNYPYAYGSDYSVKRKFNGLPTRRTRLLLRKYLEENKLCFLFDEAL